MCCKNKMKTNEKKVTLVSRVEATEAMIRRIRKKKSEKFERQGDLGLVRGGDGGNDAR
jgi:hypothetical protein